MNIFDIIILVLLLFGGIAGFQRGLITGLARFAGKIASIAIAVLFHQDFLNWLEPRFGIRENIQPHISSFLSKIIKSQTPVSASKVNTDAMIQPVVGEATIILTDYALKVISLLVLFFLVGFMLNLIITLVITPLAKSLGFVNRGGGLAFGLLSAGIVLCLVVGLIEPFLSSLSTGLSRVNDSLFYPWLMQGYDIILGVVSTFVGDIITNPLEGFSIIKDTII